MLQKEDQPFVYHTRDSSVPKLIYTFSVLRDATARRISVTSLESPIAWYCPRRCETRLSVIDETLDVSFGGSLGLSEGVLCWEEGLDDRPEDPGEVAPRLCFPERRN